MGSSISEMTPLKRVIWLIFVLPIVGGVVSTVYTVAKMRGSFNSWQSLGKPNTSDISLISIDYVEDSKGTIYKYQYETNCVNDCWIEVDALPPNSNQLDLLPFEDCEQAFNLPSLDSYSDSITECIRWGTGILVTIQAIDYTGNVIMWQKGHDDFGDVINFIISPLWGSAGGLSIGGS